MTQQDGVQQVEDDPALLDMMLSDLREAPEVYHPGNYWRNYERLFLPELRRLGVRDFRRRRGSVLNTFGATDLTPLSQASSLNPMARRFTRRGLKRTVYAAIRSIGPVSRVLGSMASALTGCSLDRVRELCYMYAEAYGASKGARPLQSLTVSSVGNPEDLFRVNGRDYTTSIIRYYLEYAYCCGHIDFGDLRTVAELGCGSGKQAEVIRTLHASLCLFLIDIPPQLYVCEQYLSAVFPGDVISYRETRAFTEPPQALPGKIYILGPWALPAVAGAGCDLFWNAASLQEMEPHLVAHYLGFVNRMTRQYVFLMESMEGQVQAAREGDHGVLARTTLDHYERGLPDFELVDLSPWPVPIPRCDAYSCSVWARTLRERCRASR